MICRPRRIPNAVHPGPDKIAPAYVVLCYTIHINTAMLNRYACSNILLSGSFVTRSVIAVVLLAARYYRRVLELCYFRCVLSPAVEPYDGEYEAVRLDL